MKVDYVEYSKQFVLKILGNNGEPTIDAVQEMWEINNGNNIVLLDHLKAISSIINKAIDELEKSDSDENKV